MTRTRRIIDWLNEDKSRTRVLEFGPFDGVNVIPILRACPHVSVTAVEAQQDAIDKMISRALEYHVEDRLTALRGVLDDDVSLSSLDYDAVIFAEVLEHVQNVSDTLQRLLRLVRPSGRLFVTTPWGAFDRGSPANITTRDPRIHVRAMTPRDLVQAAEIAQNGRVVELVRSVGNLAGGLGDTMCADIRPRSRAEPSIERPPTVFIVPSALQKWHSREVERSGIGMSEQER